MASKIYTKTGDQGQTGLFGGQRVLKDDLRIEAYGTIDELNAFVGVLRDILGDDDHQPILHKIQSNLFVIGSNLAIDPTSNIQLPGIEAEEIAGLENAIDAMDAELPELKQFILPGGHLAVSYCHLARCVCRRAERRVVALSKENHIPEIILQYLNRLSDFFFVLARKIGQDFGVTEIKWTMNT